MSYTSWPKRRARRHAVSLPAAALCLLLLVAGTAAREAGAQYIGRIGQSARVLTPQEPFRFFVPALPPEFPRDLLAEWMDAVNEHVPGKVDEPLQLVAAWSENDVGMAYSALQALLKSVKERTSPAKTVVHVGNWETTLAQVQHLLRATDVEFSERDFSRVLKCAALLHTDIAVYASGHNRRPDFITYLPHAALHFGAAMQLVDLLSDSARSRRPAVKEPFPQQWYKTVGAFLTSQYELVSTPLFLERTISRFSLGDDADVLVLAGCVQEHLASPVIQDANATEYTVPHLEGAENHLRRAERYYRNALKEAGRIDANDPVLLEARLRLGRVLGLRGEHAQAQANLKQVPADRLAPRLRYCLHLFLGQELEALGDTAAARAAYERAMALFPLAPSAHLELSRLERRAGNRPRALAEIEKVLKLRITAESEPMQNYFAGGDAQRADDLLIALEGSFRRTQ